MTLVDAARVDTDADFSVSSCIIDVAAFCLDASMGDAPAVDASKADAKVMDAAIFDAFVANTAFVDATNLA